jgi:hypothetical protein
MTKSLRTPTRISYGVSSNTGHAAGTPRFIRATDRDDSVQFSKEITNEYTIRQD